MKRRFGFRDLDFSGCEAQPFGTFLQPPREERLAASILPAHRFELGAASSNALKFLANDGLERLKAYGERIKTPLRHCAAPKRVDHFVPTLGANHWGGRERNAARTAQSGAQGS